jgi:predicted Fe-Mo cluster-binding NifX family protein
MEKLFAITSMGKTEKSFLDLRFGKSMFIVIFNPSGNQYSIIENPFREEGSCGLQLINFLQELNITSIITGEVGPKEKEKLEKDKIQLIMLREDKIRIEKIMDRITP